MIDIKPGKRLYAKKDFDLQNAVDPTNAIHKMYDVVVVTNIDNNTPAYPVTVEFNGSEEEYSFEEIEEYFYDLAEWREKQINSILDD